MLVFFRKLYFDFLNYLNHMTFAVSFICKKLKYLKSDLLNWWPIHPLSLIIAIISAKMELRCAEADWMILEQFCLLPSEQQLCLLVLLSLSASSASLHSSSSSCAGISTSRLSLADGILIIWQNWQPVAIMRSQFRFFDKVMVY